MDFLLQQNNLLILGLAILSGIMLIVGSLRKGQTADSISIQDAISLVNRERGIFLDIRPADKFREGSIAQARNLPASELDDKAGSSLPKERPIIVVCDVGQQSTSAAGKLRKLGFERAFSLKGGLRSWTQDGLPLSKSNN